MALARSIIVSPSGKVRSIQEAIDLSQAFDTVVVSGGSYQEHNILIDKPLVLIGKNTPTLDGKSKHEIISVKASKVTISGFRLQNSGYSDLVELGAIKIYGQLDVTIQDNTFENCVFGVYNLQSKRCLILNNVFKSDAKDELRSGNGIHCWYCDSMTITGNKIEGHRDGIYFEFVTNSIIERNTSYRNIRYGLHFMFSHHNTYSENVFRENGAGVAVMYSNHVTMIHNTFAENWGAAAYGILMKEISDSRVEENHFLHNTMGIYLEGSNRLEVIRNEFKSNGYAIKMQSDCSGNRVSGNNFIMNTFDVTTNGSLHLNTFRGNYWDKYDGYDLNKDETGDIPFHPLSMYAMVVEKIPESVMLLHSFMVNLLDKMERIIPTVTPEQIEDETPAMKPFSI